MPVELFKTNIQTTETANTIINQIRILIPNSRISVDLEDCDKILRIVGNNVIPSQVENLVAKIGYSCEALE